MALIETESIILKSYNLAEADKIVVFLSEDHGMIRGVAKGAKRLKSKFGSGLEPFSIVRITYKQKESVELVGIDKRVRDLARQPRVDHDSLAERSMEQLRHVENEAVHVDWAGIEGLTPGKSQEALGQCCSPLCPAQRVGDGTLQLRIAARRQAALENRQIAVDHLEKVVEVVSDAARELAHGLHLLGLAKGFFGVAATPDLFANAAFERFVERRQRLLGLLPLVDLVLGGAEKPRVVDCDCRLRSNAFHEPLMPFAEPADFFMTEE